MRTGATQAPASNAEMPPMTSTAGRRARPARPPVLRKREKSSCQTSNIASASAANRTAMAPLKSGEELIAPKTEPVKTTTSPSAP